jgi:DNA mismatch endonuclease (patch repair protein)
MAAVRTKGTDIESALATELRKMRLRWTSHDKNLPGCPDFVFRRKKVAVFVDGDFWHGYRFAVWREQIPPFWQVKIERNRDRDRKARRDLRRSGWTVVRAWGHEVKSSPRAVAMRVAAAIRGDSKRAK